VVPFARQRPARRAASYHGRHEHHHETAARAGQPDWLRAKYARQPTNPKLAALADRIIEDLAAQRTPKRIGPCKDADQARAIKNALYDAAYKRWNRTHPGDQISLSANVTDPKDGKCYARGTCRCEQNECTPSPPGAIAIHARVRSKAEGRPPGRQAPRHLGLRPAGTEATPAPGQRRRDGRAPGRRRARPTSRPRPAVRCRPGANSYR
jgi:hypothetical protein